MVLVVMAMDMVMVTVMDMATVMVTVAVPADIIRQTANIQASRIYSVLSDILEDYLKSGSALIYAIAA